MFRVTNIAAVYRQSAGYGVAAAKFSVQSRVDVVQLRIGAAGSGDRFGFGRPAHNSEHSNIFEWYISPPGNRTNTRTTDKSKDSKTMNKKLSLALLFAAVFASSPAFADADDTKWINQCIKDNKDEGAKPEVVKKYCTCMNNKMDSNETKSITQWEKANPGARTACEKEAGWK